MKTIIIMYMPGHAGNFLARLFSFDHSTMPQLPKTLLNRYIVSDSKSENLDRMKMYSFNEVESFRNWQEFHRAWSDFHQHKRSNLLAAIWKKSSIVYAVHPHEFSRFEFFMKGNANIKFFYVDLNSKDQHWVDSNQTKLSFINRDCEPSMFDKFKNNYNMKPIDLSAILESEESFLTEYYRCCEVMELPTHTDQAIKLYKDWARLRL